MGLINTKMGRKQCNVAKSAASEVGRGERVSNVSVVVGQAIRSIAEGGA